MTAFEKLTLIQEQNHSKLCVGLDSAIEKIPNLFAKDMQGLLDFNRQVINATKDTVCSYKINFAFYEQYGSDGFNVIQDTLHSIPDNIFTIADAKRGDIGNTSAAYSKAVFEKMNFDSITVNPYMGSDCVLPFLENKEKLVFLLALTSNKGSDDFQQLMIEGGTPLYQKVIEVSSRWADETQIAYVVGATHPKDLKNIREIIPDRFLLFPGVGTQGGDTEELLKSNNKNPYLINVSRDIIYTAQDEEFAEKIKTRAAYYRDLFNNIDKEI